MSCSDIFLGLVACIFPPIAVWIKSGLCSADSLINILLCMLGFIPGLVHAWYIIAKSPEHDDHDYAPIADAEAGRVRRQQRQQGGQIKYYYVNAEQLAPDAQRTYGTQATASKPGNKPARGGAPAPASGSGAGSSSQANASTPEGAPPPSYNEVVRGDHKIQTQD